MRFRLITCFLLSAALVVAQDDRKATAYFGGGISPTSGDFGDRHEMGWGLLGGGGYKVNRNFVLNLEWNYDKLSYKYSNPNVPPNLPPGVLTALDGTTKVNGYSFNPRWNFRTKGPVSGFVTGGYGIYNRDFEITRPGAGTEVVCDPWWGLCYEGLVPVDYLLRENSTWKGGFNVGGGIEFGAGSTKFFVDARYRYIYTTNVRTSYIPITIGYRF